MAQAQIKVMVIDTGFVPTPYTKHKVVAFSNKDDFRGVGHGTAVTHTLLYGDIIEGKATSEVCDKVEVEICGYTHLLTADAVMPCLTRAKEKGFDYVNLSTGGVLVYSKDERDLFKKVAESGIKIVMSSGNNSLDLDKVCTYPQCYANDHPNIIVVGSSDGTLTTGSFVKKGEAWSYSTTNTGKVVRFVGTSFAAPKYINQMLLQRCPKKKGEG
jgi:hypothetical protein